MTERFDAYRLAAVLGVKPARLRQWAKRGVIQRKGTGEKGRALYDPDEVREQLRRARQRRACNSSEVVSQ
jgi:DNA-binding transcriptional MerR regulator